MRKKDKPRYKIINRAKYNEALVNRGNLQCWISDEVTAKWRHDNPDGLQGRLFLYSDLAIEVLLTVRKLYPRATVKQNRIGGRTFIAFS